LEGPIGAESAYVTTGNLIELPKWPWGLLWVPLPTGYRREDTIAVRCGDTIWDILVLEDGFPSVEPRVRSLVGLPAGFHIPFPPTGAGRGGRGILNVSQSTRAPRALGLAAQYMFGRV